MRECTSLDARKTLSTRALRVYLFLCVYVYDAVLYIKCFICVGSGQNQFGRRPAPTASQALL